MDIWRFTGPSQALASQVDGIYNPLLVIVPIGLSFLAGFTALLVLDRMAANDKSGNRSSWLFAGALALGGGIWAVHFTAMLSYTLPFNVQYSLAMMGVSVLPAIVGGGLALHFIQLAEARIWDLRLIAGAVFLASGMCGMHYIGMESMHMPAELRYDSGLFAASILVTHALVLAAIFVYQLLVRFRRQPAFLAPFVGGVFIGMAIVGMHVSTMSAARFYALPQNVGTYNQIPHAMEASTIVAFTILILVITILSTWGDNIRQVMDEQTRTDALTGLPNRLALNEYLADVMRRHGTEYRSLHLLIVGLTDFNVINASLGHAAGDSVLKEIALRLQPQVEEHHFVARFAGDEFAVVLQSDEEAEEDISGFVEQILKTIELPLTAGGLRLYLQAGLGISSYEGEDIHPEVLIDQAHNAMRAAKFSKLSYRFYSRELGDYAREQMWLRAEVQNALSDDQMELQYQPQVMLESRKLIGLEALVRWYHPDKGWISPEQFIPVIDQIGLVLELDALVLDKACMQARQWLDAGIRIGRIAVNLSPRFLEQATAVGNIAQVLEKYNLSGEYLQLEVTENKLLNYEYVVAQRFIDIKKMGVTISIDDFGTGYSSLSYLKDLPVDNLKLDQSFVKKLAEDARSRAIPQSVLGMADGLGLSLIAEGIETERQRQILVEIGYTKGQGYLFSQPLTADDISSLDLDAIKPGQGDAVPATSA